MTPLSLQHPHSLPGTTHFPVTLAHSSGWGSTFNRNCALAGVLPLWEQTWSLQAARFALGAAARTASRRINPRSRVFPGPGCGVTVLARDGSTSPATDVLHPKLVSRASRFLGLLELQELCQSLDRFLTESGND